MTTTTYLEETVSDHTPQQNMKRKFLVIALGYWGRGETLKEAAQNCHKAGASRKDHCVATLFTHPDRDPDPRTDGFMVEYAEGSEKIEIGSLFKIGQLLNLK